MIYGLVKKEINKEKKETALYSEPMYPTKDFDSGT